jgi:hypothetical protein
MGAVDASQGLADRGLSGVQPRGCVEVAMGLRAITERRCGQAGPEPCEPAAALT